MFDEPFAHGKAPIHRLDPRARLLMGLAFCLAVASVKSMGSAALAVAVAGALLAAAAPPLPALLRRLGAIAGFLLMLWLTIPWVLPGPPALVWGPVTASWPGIHLAALATLKGLAIVLATTALVASMTIATLGHALSALGTPTRLVVLLLFTYRHIFSLFASWTRLWDAARLRGFIPRTTSHSYHTLATMVGVLLLRALDQAHRSREAMLLRGFTGQLASITLLQARPRDWGLTTAFLLGSVALVILDALHPWP